MSNVIPLQHSSPTPSFKTLEELLNELSKYGEVSIRYFKDKTWYCCIDMFVIGEGISFKIASDFKQPTAMNAAETCRERLISALKDIGNKSKSLPHTS
ncbi:MAG: hypothetical protein ACD_33C00046G0013 [uncultured bacterium]|nr:MAG: hypothetical protein ACD_33C00046G0013 [uncultured bacterium]